MSVSYLISFVFERENALKLTELSALNVNDVDSDATDAGFREASNLPRHHYNQQPHQPIMSSRSQVSSSLGEENEDEVESDDMIVTSSTYSPSSIENTNHMTQSNRVTVKSLKAKKSQHKPSILIESSSLIQKAVTTTTTTTQVSTSNQNRTATTLIKNDKVQSSDNDADIDEAAETTPVPMQSQTQLNRVEDFKSSSGNIVMNDLRSFKRDNYYKFNTLTMRTNKSASTNNQTNYDQIKYNTVKSSAALASSFNPAENTQCRVLPIMINVKNPVATSSSTINMNTSTFVQPLPTSSTNNLDQSNVNNASGNGVKDDSINAAENVSLGKFFFYKNT